MADNGKPSKLMLIGLVAGMLVTGSINTLAKKMGCECLVGSKNDPPLLYLLPDLADYGIYVCLCNA